MDKEIENKISDTPSGGDLWQAAREMNKYNFISAMEGRAKSLWIMAIFLVIAAIIAYFIVPEPMPGITNVELFPSENIVVACNPNFVFLVDMNNGEILDNASFELENAHGINLSENILTLYDMNNHTKQTIDFNDGMFGIISDIVDFKTDLKHSIVYKNSNNTELFFSWEKTSVVSDENNIQALPNYYDASGIRFLSSFTAYENTYWIADYDRLLMKKENNDNWSAITPFEDRAIKHITTINDNIAIIYEDGTFLMINDNGKILDKKRLSPWTGFGHGDVSDIEGEIVVSATKMTIQIGKISDKKPVFKVNLREVIK